MITIEISPEGDPTISTSGIVGKACEDVTVQLESMVGKVTANTRTAEYYHEPRKNRVKR